MANTRGKKVKRLYRGCVFWLIAWDGEVRWWMRLFVWGLYVVQG